MKKEAMRKTTIRHHADQRLAARKKRRLRQQKQLERVALLVMTLLLAVSLPGWGPASKTAHADEEATETWVDSDFESVTIGDKPGSPWLFGSQPAGANVAVQALGTNKVLRFAQYSETANNYMPRVDLGEDIEQLVLRYRVRASQTNANLYLPSLMSATNSELTRISMGTGGNFVIWNNATSAWDPLLSYTPGEWYTVEMVLDQRIGKFDLRIDGEWILAGQDAQVSNQDARYVRMGIYRKHTGTFYVDDLSVSAYKSASDVAFAVSPDQISVNDSRRLDLTYTPVDASMQSAVWSTSDDTIATVDSFGLVTGISAGQATITAMPHTPGVAPTSVVLDVYGSPPASVVLNRSALQLETGGRARLDAQVLPLDAANKGVVWTTSDSIIATVTATGEVIGHAAGSATITASSVLNEAVNAAITVEVTAEQAPAPGDLLHEDFEAHTEGLPPGVGWSVSSAPSEVDITVEASSSGDQLLTFSQTATMNYSYSGIVDLEESGEVAVLSYRVRALQSSGFIYLPRFFSSSGGELMKLGMSSGGSFVVWDTTQNGWKSIGRYVAGQWYDLRIALDTNTGALDVSIDGESAAVQWPQAQSGVDVGRIGMGFYRLSKGSFQLDDLNVYSEQSATTAEFEQNSYTVPLHGMRQLRLVFDPSSATWQSAYWSSANSAVAEVDAQGRVSGVGIGSTTITADPVAPGLPSISASVTVEEVLPASVAVDATALTLVEGANALLYAALTPEEVSFPAITWSTSDAGVATVDEGYIEALSPGTAVVTVASQAYSSVAQTIAVTVVPDAAPLQLYVSPSGSDSGDGSLGSPFQTLARAQAEVRARNANMDRDIVVNVRGGLYRLSGTWQLGTADSGTNGFRVSWQAYPEEEPVISGGLAVSGWTLYDAETGIYKADLPSGTVSRQLFIDGVRATRARSAGGLHEPQKTNDGYVSDDVALTEFARPQDLEFVYKEQWTNPRIGVASVSLQNGKARFYMDEPGWSSVTNKGGTSATFPVYYENAYELLDEAGEWYLNEQTSELFYKPRVWENMSTVEATLPVVEQLLEIAGESVDAQVRHIRFEGLTFADTTWMRPSTTVGHSDAQNNHLRDLGTPDVLPPAAVTVSHGYDIDFERNTFTRLGITALKLEEGVQFSEIRGNQFFDLSGGAVNVGEPSVVASNANPEHPRMRMRSNDVVNNYVHDIGVDFMSAAAISAGFPENMRIQNNELFSIPYSGMHIGYGWDYEFDNVLRNTHIEHNFIHDLMGQGIYDGGGIYTLGSSGGDEGSYNTVSYNYIRNQMNDYGPLYPDQGSSYWKFSHNVIDVLESPYWNSGTARWTHGNSNRNVVFDNNYTTTANRNSNGAVNVSFTNTHVYEDADWPEAAQAIIADSGLTAAYADIRRGYTERLHVQEELVLTSSGPAGTIAISATDGKDATLDTSHVQVYLQAEDESIVSISGNGDISGLQKGHTTIHVYMLDRSLLRTAEVEVYVDDELDQVALARTPQLDVFHVTVGEAYTPSYIGRTEMDRLVELDEVTAVSSAPSALAIGTNGALTASSAGSYTLTVTGEVNGVERSQPFTVIAQQSGVGVATPLADELADLPGWYIAKTGSATGNGSGTAVTLSSANGHAVYQGKTYLNEVLGFDMTIQATGGWPSLLLRNQDAQRGIEGTTYIMTIKSDVIELQRFNKGQRTVIYGNISGYTSLGGPAISNTMLPYGQTHTIQFGAINESGGVRLVAEVEGQPLFNFLDTGAGAIREEGYLGVYARTGSTTLAVETP
ncbi:Ig-like domain-containing protein [Paenibacillus sp. IB182496]|uniref:Ig-like domain-containing protein n=1 Tax=Paenibacillus sabuli TaxID=2772509 RepID=A0A927GTN7_9BACL|nr:Ig-like domain-containing protein [Paenibacillus sabuli]MBD2847803.1 Ig-like domain-containing protein [Paenibacillus sabuli]